MKHDILAPMVGESITEVSILKWTKKNGEAVKSGDVLLEIESDKATVEIVAENSGALTRHQGTQGTLLCAPA
jgi:2-oxoglutarate dehydrogenase E2 component (dihydrolipoamide succinyltransferase)